MNTRGLIGDWVTTTKAFGASILANSFSAVWMSLASVAELRFNAPVVAPWKLRVNVPAPIRVGTVMVCTCVVLMSKR